MLACNRTSGRSTPLTDEVEELEARLVRVAGPFVAIAVNRETNGDYSDGSVKVFDTRTGAERSVIAISVTDLVVSPGGAAAWVEGSEGYGYAVRVCARSDCPSRRPDGRTLASGDQIRARSLSLRGARLTWLEGSHQKSASWRRPTPTTIANHGDDGRGIDPHARCLPREA